MAADFATPPTHPGIFGLLQIVAFVNYVRSFVSEKQFQILFQAFIVVAAAIMFVVLVLATMTGVVAPWTGRFYSLWDTGYAKKYIPIIASVSEHQPTAWPSFIFDLHFLIAVFPAGVYFCFRRLKDEHVFVIVYAVTAAYFSGVMVRLMLTLTPIVCVASAVAVSEVLDTYLKTGNGEKTVTAAAPAGTATEVPSPATATPGKAAAPVKAPTARSAEEKAFLPNPSYAVVFVVVVILLQFVWHCTWVTSNAYSSPSVVLASRAHDGSQLIIDDFREAYYWLMQNTPQDAKVMSWWDYGYQIAGMANRTTLVDNNTWWVMARGGPRFERPDTEITPLYSFLGTTHTLPLSARPCRAAKKSLMRLCASTMWTMSSSSLVAPSATRAMISTNTSG